MATFLLVVHVIVCLVLIMVVLLQSGKAADLAGAFGGGGSQTALGSRGAATFLTKATTISAILFMFTSLGLALLGSRQGGSVLESVPPASEAPAPANAPASPPGGPEGGASGAAPSSPSGPEKQEGTAPSSKDSTAPAKETAPKKTP
jgi:preprotein translocase subunit SecG